MAKRLQPPIRYFGGKNTMFKRILAEFPNPEDYDLYMEPFAGSYGIGLKIIPTPTMEIYNDLDKNVYSLYKVLQDAEMFEEFKRKCDFSYYSEDLRNEFREGLKDSEAQTLYLLLYGLTSAVYLCLEFSYLLLKARYAPADCLQHELVMLREHTFNSIADLLLAAL